MNEQYEDEDVFRYLVWSSRLIGCAQALREALRRVQRLIDFDGTIAVPGNGGHAPRDQIRGVPLAAFLAEVPFAVQTWNPPAAVRFFLELRQDLPRPELIIIAPMCDLLDERGAFVDVGKDFAAFGISDAAIIDDMPAASIHAPGCTILSP